MLTFWVLDTIYSSSTLYFLFTFVIAMRITGHEVMASIEPILSPVILDLWAADVSDPFSSIDALEVLEVTFFLVLSAT